ncbi:IS21 family transposase [Luteovulum azotoformans]|nr:IS21 family transposase [Cereibacter azotoformans]MBO4168449.1 IS21 family transposase [Cereibacter azotoformans]
MTDRLQHSQRVAAARAGFSERTARRIDADPRLPSQRPAPRGRTVPDPLEAVWEPVLLPILARDPAVQAVTLLRHLQTSDPEAFPDDRVRRTLERRVRDWRALNGPERDVIFRQTPEPGRMALSDFTDANELCVTIAGQPLEQRLYHFVLAYSGWEHAAVVLGGESFPALAENLQNALWTLGGVPGEHRTDSLSAAYRNLDAEAAADVTKRYDAFCAHYGMLASRNNPGEAHENGSVEAHNNHLKVALDQALILRGSRDFADLASWRRFVDELVARRNRRRESAVRIEMAALRPLPARRTTDFTEVVARVTKTGGFLVHQVFYSAPSQLIGKRSNRRFASGETGPCLRRPDRGLSRSDPCRHAPRRRGRDDGTRVHCVNYRHVIHALRRKPQALAGSVYRDGLFPRSEYAEAWVALSAALPRRDACRRMVDLLWLAHEEGCEAELAALIAQTLGHGELPEAHALRSKLEPRRRELPDDTPVNLTDLARFDELLEARA